MEEDSGLKHVWNSHIRGYAGAFTEDVIDLIRGQPEVDYVERDQIVHALETQHSAPWVSRFDRKCIFPRCSTSFRV